MPKYLCMQRSEPQTEKTGPAKKPSPTEMQAMYAAFQAWQEKFKDNIVDMGGKLGDGKLVRAEAVSDGPFVEAKELIGGYMIVQAETIDDAIEVARGVPGLVSERSGVWVREIHTP